MGLRRFFTWPREDYFILAGGIALAIALRASLLDFTTISPSCLATR